MSEWKQPKNQDELLTRLAEAHEQEKRRTECCDAPLPVDRRFCPKCGWEARVKEGCQFSGAEKAQAYRLRALEQEIYAYVFLWIKLHYFTSGS